MLRHTAFTDGTVDLEGACEACGYAYTARVISLGTGSANSFVGFDRAHAKREAAAEATAEMVHQAHVTMSLVPCRRCGHRSRRAVVSFIIEQAIPFLVVVGVAALAVWLRAPWWVTALVGAGAVGQVWLAYKRFNAVATRVLSITPRVVEPAPADRVDLPRAVVVADAPPPRAPAPADPTANEGAPRLLR
jgi:hypothetical protein